MKQNEEAMKLANEIRLRRVQLKREMHRDPRIAISALEEVPKWLRAERVERFLCYLPRVGHKRAQLILNEIPSRTDQPFGSALRTVGNLTPREKNLLIALLKARISA